MHLAYDAANLFGKSAYAERLSARVDGYDIVGLEITEMLRERFPGWDKGSNKDILAERSREKRR